MEAWPGPWTKTCKPVAQQEDHVDQVEDHEEHQEDRGYKRMVATLNVGTLNSEVKQALVYVTVSKRRVDICFCNIILCSYVRV